MGAGAFIEPLVVVTLLFGGTWVNRNRSYRIFSRHPARFSLPRSLSPSSTESGYSSPRSSVSLLSHPSILVHGDSQWRTREIRLFGCTRSVKTPDTRQFEDEFLSRVLMKFPFLIEAWYWALIYWVYQLGRAFTALTLSSTTVDTARLHALQVIRLEQRLHIFIELPIQHYFLRRSALLHWTNRIYSFIHIPGTILFLVWLYYYTTLRTPEIQYHGDTFPITSPYASPHANEDSSQSCPATPALYAARRRTMATCNLLAFCVFTLWPCMPPRLLSDPAVSGTVGRTARSFGFVDTVHGAKGESSVWTQNRFCNQYAAMPSLHFGYALLIGLTVATMPLARQQGQHRRPRTLRRIFASPCSPSVSMKRVLCIVLGATYPLVILFAIIATANHFVLDAVAGALVCGLAWAGNRILLNLLVLEDWFLWVLRLHKPARADEGEEDGLGIRGWQGDGDVRKGGD